MVIQLKDVGFDLREINELTAQDYVDYTDVYIKANSPEQAKQPQARRATQADMDRFTRFVGKR